MKLYTKKGDGGQTGVLGKDRLSKADVRIEAYGTVDELSAWIGYLRDQPVNRSRTAALIAIQEYLFIIGAQLACTQAAPLPKGIPILPEEATSVLERDIDIMQAALPPMRYFILAGGDAQVSIGHIARCVCRRAERAVVALAQEVSINTDIVVYLNRLSDYLFALCRTMADELEIKEQPWIPKKG